MSKQEKIVCAAVQLKVNYNGKIRNIDIPYISTHQEIHIMEFKGSIQRVINWNIESERLGFITNKNRFVDPVEAMKIAVKTGQYPDYELMKRKALEEIRFAKENEKHNESVGILGFKLFVADIPKLVSRVKELDKLLGRDYLLPKDLY